MGGSRERHHHRWRYISDLPNRSERQYRDNTETGLAPVRPSRPASRAPQDEVFPSFLLKHHLILRCPREAGPRRTHDAAGFFLERASRLGALIASGARVGDGDDAVLVGIARIAERNAGAERLHDGGDVGAVDPGVAVNVAQEGLGQRLGADVAGLVRVLGQRADPHADLDRAQDPAMIDELVVDRTRLDTRAEEDRRDLVDVADFLRRLAVGPDDDGQLRLAVDIGHDVAGGGAEGDDIADAMIGDEGRIILVPGDDEEAVMRRRPGSIGGEILLQPQIAVAYAAWAPTHN